MNKTKKIFKYFSQIISWSIIIILVVFGLFLVFIFATSKFSSKDGKYAPMGLYTIISPSMTPNIEVYDVVFAMQTPSSKIKVGDIITFYSKNEFLKGTPVTHRVVDITTTNMGKKYNTKGDGNDAYDAEEIYESEVVGKVYFKIPKLGKVQFWLSSKSSLFIVVLIPAIIIIAYDLYKMLKKIAFGSSDTSKDKKQTISTTVTNQTVPTNAAPLVVNNVVANTSVVQQQPQPQPKAPVVVAKPEIVPNIILPMVPVVKEPEKLIIIPAIEIISSEIETPIIADVKQEPIIVIESNDIIDKPVKTPDIIVIEQPHLSKMKDNKKNIIKPNNKPNKHFKNKEKYNNVQKHKKKKKHGKVKKS